jgi:hypothetical protein
MDVIQLMPLAFVAMGLLFAFLGVRGLTSDARLRRRGLAAEAEITDVRYEWRGDTPGERSRLSFAVLRFALPDGRTVETQASFGASWSPGKVGDRVPILYDPADPTRARIARGMTGAAPRILGAGMIVFGIVFALAGAGFFVLFRLIDLPG